MLFNCYTSWLYMRVLKLTLGKIIFLQIFLQFLFFSVKCLEGLLLRPDGCGSKGRMVKWKARWSGDMSRRAWPCRMLMWHCASGRVSTVSGWGLHRVKYRFHPSHRTPFVFHLTFCLFWCDFFMVSHDFSVPFCSFVLIYLISRYFGLSLIFFLIILTIKIFLWNILEIKTSYLFSDICCEVGIICYGIYLDCIGLFCLFVFFGKSILL
jgi:hypothetical protein